jgi:integrase
VEKISEKIVCDLPLPDEGNKLHYFSGVTLQGKKAPSGFAVRVTAAGTKSFVWFHRIAGKPHLETLGRWDENAKGGSLTVRDAIIAAQKRAQAIGKGEDPRPKRTRRQEDGARPASANVSGLLDQFVERYVKKEAKLRSVDQIEDTFDRLVKPQIGKLGIYDIRRSHVVTMLDEIADGNVVSPETGRKVKGGPVMADRALAYVRKAFNWYAARDDDFQPPIVKGMARTKPKERKRKRVLDDEEIRDLWAGLEMLPEPECYPRFVKSILLTASRRNEASMLHSAELDGDLWTIPGERYKTKLDHVVPITAELRALIGTEQVRAPSGKPKKNARYIFSTTEGEKPFSGFSKAKRELDAAISELRESADRSPMPNWTLHDLRRTARSLMSRAKVPSDHAERAMGHVMGGVRETYDRYEYLDEKRAAFEALASLVARILNPTSNVEELAARRVPA